LGEALEAHVGTVGGLPFVVGFGEDGTDEADHGFIVREDPDDIGTPLDLLVHSLQWVRRGDLGPMRVWKHSVRCDVMFSLSKKRGSFQIPVLKELNDLSQLGAGRAGVGLHKYGANGCSHHLFVALGNVDHQVPHQMHLATLPRGALEHAPDGGLQPAAGTRDHKSHPAETTVFG